MSTFVVFSQLVRAFTVFQIKCGRFTKCMRLKTVFNNSSWQKNLNVSNILFHQPTNQSPVTHRGVFFYCPFSWQFKWCANCQLTHILTLTFYQTILLLLLLLPLDESSASLGQSTINQIKTRRNRGNAGMNRFYLHFLACFFLHLWDRNCTLFFTLSRRESNWKFLWRRTCVFVFISQAQGSTSLYLFKIYTLLCGKFDGLLPLPRETHTQITRWKKL